MIAISNAEYDYFIFLRETLFGKQSEYDHFLKHLHSITFYAFVPNDDNRIEDGLALRQLFMHKYEALINEDYFLEDETPVSVLEMLIALSFRIEAELLMTSNSKKVVDAFLMLLNNLKLPLYSNVEYKDNQAKIENTNRIINKVLERTYERSGKGGLFPLKYPKTDQRKLEIWYQMAGYLQENFEI